MVLTLPEEIWVLIFRYLDITSLQNSQLVCKKWLDIILNDVVMSGEYTLYNNRLNSSQINTILAKRKKLQIFRCPDYRYYCRNTSDENARDMEEGGLTIDLRFVNFKVCKDLKKVVVEHYR